MRHNKHLSTQNTVLKELNKQFYVCIPFNEYENKKNTRFLVYDAPDSGGLFFKFEVMAKPSAKKYVYFNEKPFSEIEPLLKAVEEYDAGRPFSPLCYDPNNRVRANFEQKLVEYMGALGYKSVQASFGKELAFEISDAYGDLLNVLSISYSSELEDDSVSGFIYRSIKKSESSLTSKFDSEDEAFKILNTFLMTDAAVNIKKCVTIIDNLKFGFSDMEKSKILDMKSFFSGESKNAKEKLVPILEDLLKTLKSGN